VNSGLAQAGGRAEESPLNELVLTLPGDALVNVRIPPAEMGRELRRRLAAALFCDGIVGGAAACRLAGMGKAQFQTLARRARDEPAAGHIRLPGRT
jgi:hypothetical protein